MSHDHLHPDEPWTWPEAEWRHRVNQVRAGRNLRPETWPGGARCAVALSFDSDHETNELRDGGRSIGRMSWGQYGSRVGVPRILALLQRTQVPATFFVPAVSALLYPDEQRRVVAEGLVVASDVADQSRRIKPRRTGGRRVIALREGSIGGSDHAQKDDTGSVPSWRRLHP